MDIKDLYEKTLLRGIKEDFCKWKDILCFWNYWEGVNGLQFNLSTYCSSIGNSRRIWEELSKMIPKYFSNKCLKRDHKIWKKKGLERSCPTGLESRLCDWGKLAVLTDASLEWTVYLNVGLLVRFNIVCKQVTSFCCNDNDFWMFAKGKKNHSPTHILSCANCKAQACMWLSNKT